MFDSKIATVRSEVCYAKRERRYSTSNGAYTYARRAYNRAVRRSVVALVAHERALHDAALAQDAREEVHALRLASWRGRMAEAEACLAELREVHREAYYAVVAAYESGAPNDHLDVLGERLEELSCDLAIQTREVEWLDMNEPQL